MSVVQVYLGTEDDPEIFVGIIDGDRIKAHSAKVREIIATREPKLIQQVHFSGPDFAAISYVVDKIRVQHPREVLRISVSDLPLTRAIAVHRAVLCMRIEPEQDHILGHLKGYVAHKLVSLRDMEIVYNEYGWHSKENEGYMVYKAMIDKIAWEWYHGRLSEDGGLFSAMDGYPGLKRLVEGKTTGLRKGAENRARREARGEDGGAQES